MPRHIVEAYGESWTDPDHIATNGAFRLESYKPGEYINLVRNSTYHGGSSGNLEQVEALLRNTRSGPEQLEMYEMDRVDIAYLSDETFQARYRYAEEYVCNPSQRLYFMGFDTSCPPFADVRVRRAFAMAVNVERLADES